MLLEDRFGLVLTTGDAAAAADYVAAVDLRCRPIRGLNCSSTGRSPPMRISR